MWKWLKQIKTRFYPNLDSGCAWLNHTHILDDAHISFNIDSKNYIFRNLIKQRYNMWDQTSMLETLKSKLT